MSKESTGLSFGSILFFIFLVMKLMNYIDLSWWWVTSPLWLPITLILGVVGIAAALSGIFIIGLELISCLCSKRKNKNSQSRD